MLKRFSPKMSYDVLIAGGGPAGATLGALLRKYDPAIRVLILERERFPRDHVGESQLPAVCEILDEMGVWNKVEAADFPIKIGASYRWGLTDEVWDFNFVAGGKIPDENRPARYEGPRKRTAFQVDRSVYDKILLDHARELGCEVYEGIGVRTVHHSGDYIDGVTLESRGGEPLPEELRDQPVTAACYCDCTGAPALFRRALGVGIESPTSLRNVAVWDYWQDADWAVTIGQGGTRVQVMSLGWGWLWFIPVGKTRSSLGLVTPVDHLRSSGKSLEALYEQAIHEDPLISRLIANATRENLLQTTKDWSFVADRVTGENWFWAGDTAGFADPILAAGLTLAQSAARRLAYTILELRTGQLDANWLRSEYETIYKFQVGHHIKFADFWYSANAMFTDLKENCSKIAADAGLSLNPDEAFFWLGTGGFARDTAPGVARAANWSLGHVKHLVERFSTESPTWAISANNCFRLNLAGATKEYVAHYDQGHVVPVVSYARDNRQLPMVGLYHLLVEVLKRESDLRAIADHVWNLALTKRFGADPQAVFASAMEVLEAMVTDGWVTATRNRKKPFLKVMFAPDGYGMEFVERT